VPVCRFRKWKIIETIVLLDIRKELARKMVEMVNVIRDMSTEKRKINE